MEFRKKRRFGNRKEVVEEEGWNSVDKLLKGKNQEIKNLQARINRLLNNAKENEVGEFIIDRSKSPQEIENQINCLPDKFKEIEGKAEAPATEGEFYDVGDLEEKLSEVEDATDYKPPSVINSKRKKRR